jgi:hypothetical protein
MRRAIRLGLTPALLLGLFAPAARAEGPAAKPDTKPVAVPFELLPSRHMVIKAMVNGKGPYRLIFDTGAPIMLINTKLAKEAGVTDKAMKPAFSPFGAMGQFSIKSLELGDLKAEGVSTIVMDHPTVSLISKFFGPIDGIVGFPFFARYRTTVDYQAKELTFVPNGFKPVDMVQALTVALLARSAKSDEVRTVAPAGQWGLVVDKGDKDDAAGVTVTEVRPDSAAAKAGVKPGDRLLTLDGRWTDSVTDAFQAASRVKPGRAVALVVRRGGQDVTLTVAPRAGL